MRIEHDIQLAVENGLQWGRCSEAMRGFSLTMRRTADALRECDHALRAFSESLQASPLRRWNAKRRVWAMVRA